MWRSGIDISDDFYFYNSVRNSLQLITSKNSTINSLQLSSINFPLTVNRQVV